MIPIKGYATFDPLKHCWIGSAFKIEWFKNTPFYKNDKIMSPLKRIAEETEQDFQMLEKDLYLFFSPWKIILTTKAKFDLFRSK